MKEVERFLNLANVLSLDEALNIFTSTNNTSIFAVGKEWLLWCFRDESFLFVHSLAEDKIPRFISILSLDDLMGFLWETTIPGCDVLFSKELKREILINSGFPQDMTERYVNLYELVGGYNEQ